MTEYTEDDVQKLVKEAKAAGFKEGYETARLDRLNAVGVEEGPEDSAYEQGRQAGEREAFEKCAKIAGRHRPDGYL